MTDQAPERDIVFLDTETLGRYLDSPIWEVAAIRRDITTGAETELHMFVEHLDPALYPAYDELPESFKQDYNDRYDRASAVSKLSAAELIVDFMAPSNGEKPAVIGRVPSFDTDRIHYQYLAPMGIDEPWHYGGIRDISDVVLGYLNGAAAVAIDMSTLFGIEIRSHLLDRKRAQSFWSNDLSRAVGIDPDDYPRHTAMGDCRWVRAQYDAVTTGPCVVVMS